MTLTDRITHDIADAMRARDQARLAPLRMAKAAIMNTTVAKGRDLDDAEAEQVLAGLIKQRHDSAEQFAAAGRVDLADRERAEIVVLEGYLPPPVDNAELEAAVDAAIAEAGASSTKDLGAVMKVVMPRLAGRRADGKTVNELVRRKLQQG